jgi:hypothetical protein
MMQTIKSTQTDTDLDKLVACGDIIFYRYSDVHYTNHPDYQSVVITLPSGNKLCVYSSSTPAPESSYLTFEFVDKDVKLT